MLGHPLSLSVQQNKLHHLTSTGGLHSTVHLMNRLTNIKFYVILFWSFHTVEMIDNYNINVIMVIMNNARMVNKLLTSIFNSKTFCLDPKFQIQV